MMMIALAIFGLVCSYEPRPRPQAWSPILDCYTGLALTATSPDTGSSLVTKTITKPPAKNQLWMMDLEGRVYNYESGLVIDGSGSRPSMKHPLPITSSKQWKVRTDIRSVQETEPETVPKIVENGRLYGLNTANRFLSGGSPVIMYNAKELHPDNACWKTSFDKGKAGPVWRKVYSLNTAGGLFKNLDDTKKKNIDDPEADLFSILYDLESMRNDKGVFHFKLCYPELAEDFPCNEWTQSSNPLTQQTITGFAGITVTWNSRSIGGPFQGLGLSPPSFGVNLIDGEPAHINRWYSIGSLKPHGGPETVPGPHPTPVKKVELSVLYTPGG